MVEENRGSSTGAGNSEAIVRSNGLSFPDDTRIMTDQLRTLLSRGNYEASEARALKTFVNAGSSVVELGAGIGYISSLVVRHHAAGHVTCIEANPLLCDYIRRVHDANDVKSANVINAVALPGPRTSEMVETVPFYVARPFWSSSLRPPKGVPHEEIEVPTLSLDEVLAQAGADALICDIEGGEGALLEEADLAPIRFALVELHTNRIRSEGVVKLFEAMHRHGFFYHQQASGAGLVLFKRFRAPALATRDATGAPDVAPYALEHRAPKRHAIRVHMLDLMPKGGRCAEVGVWSGEFSHFILERTAPCQLVLIDPWDMLASGEDGPHAHSKWGSAAAMREMYLAVTTAYADRPEVLVAKGYAGPTLETFPDGYFDWIYIDGNHHYDHVSADLRSAARKLRVGGIIAGDDFFWKKDGRHHVRDAVFDFLATAGLPRALPLLPQDAHEVTTPARLGQQFLIPVTEAMKDETLAD